MCIDLGYCAGHSSYNVCGSSCGDVTCASFGKTKICNETCQPGCFCDEGYVSHQLSCISHEECPGLIWKSIWFRCFNYLHIFKLLLTGITCTGKFESYSDCVSGCADRHCGDNFDRPCMSACKQGCYCDAGYARNELHECIPIAECSKGLIKV